MSKKKKIIILLLIIVLIAIIILMIAMGNKTKEERRTTFEGETANSNIKIEDIEFTDITKKYENGVTTIRANILNNTNQTKNINVKIILKDENGNEINSMIQAIENIEPDRKKVLSTGIMGNYTDVKDIEFEVLSDSELSQYN